MAGGGIVVLEAPPEEHDAILLDRVAAWLNEGPVSFLRANKPGWRLEVTRDALDEDAVADTALVLDLLRSERDGRPLASRREIVISSMDAVAARLRLTDPERRLCHEEGFRWAERLGRWDAEAIAALEGRFGTMRAALDDFLARPVDRRIAMRWERVNRGDDPVAEARRLISCHANRLGVFAEAEAILHFFMWRRHGGGAREGT